MVEISTPYPAFVRIIMYYADVNNKTAKPYRGTPPGILWGKTARPSSAGYAEHGAPWSNYSTDITNRRTKTGSELTILPY